MRWDNARHTDKQAHRENVNRRGRRRRERERKERERERERLFARKTLGLIKYMKKNLAIEWIRFFVLFCSEQIKSCSLI